MILLSLNIRGVGGPLKAASLRRLLSKTLSDIIFLQETMVAEDKARHFMFSIRPEWMIFVVSSVRKLDRLMVSWDPKKFYLLPFPSCGSIFLSGTCLVDKRRISFLNVYVPCTDRKQFWEKVDGSGMLTHGDLIIVGDMNFMTNSKEVWGATTLVDPLMAFLKVFFFFFFFFNQL
jgi:hypothetical protein